MFALRLFRPLSVIPVQLLTSNNLVFGGEKSHSLVKIEIDGLQRIEGFDACAEIVQTIICDCTRAIRN